MALNKILHTCNQLFIGSSKTGIEKGVQIGLLNLKDQLQQLSVLPNIAGVGFLLNKITSTKAPIKNIKVSNRFNRCIYQISSPEASKRLHQYLHISLRDKNLLE
ncbi:hypothetical protein SFC43_07300 [Bacteroides sp. CR5/BHMF/2]|nr:hypothetical protein [Bacteroides sp. CR5/BHMF/2]